MRERFRVANNKVTSSQSNSRNVLNITDCWDLTVEEDLTGDFSFNVAANDTNTSLCSSTLNKNLPRLPHSHCSDFLIVIFWYTCWQKCLVFLFLYLYFCIFVFCRQGICHLQFLYWNYLFHVAYFQIGDFCLIYWFHCTNVILCLLFHSVTSQIYNKRWYLFSLCVNFLPHNPLPQTCLLSAALIFSDLQSMYKQSQRLISGILFLPLFVALLHVKLASSFISLLPCFRKSNTKDKRMSMTMSAYWLSIHVMHSCWS